MEDAQDLRLLPTASEPVPTTTVLHHSWILSLDIAEERKSFEIEVERGLLENLTSVEALQRAAHRIGIEDIKYTAPRSGRHQHGNTPHRPGSIPDDHDPVIALLGTVLDQLSTGDVVSLARTDWDLLASSNRHLAISLASPPPHRDDLVHEVQTELRTRHNMLVLQTEATETLERWKRQAKAKKFFHEDPGGALRKMTKTPDPESTSSLEDLVEVIRDRGAAFARYQVTTGYPQAQSFTPTTLNNIRWLICTLTGMMLSLINSEYVGGRPRPRKSSRKVSNFTGTGSLRNKNTPTGSSPPLPVFHSRCSPTSHTRPYK